MSKERIKVSIDVTKIDKSHFVVGAKGTYVDMVLIPTPDNKYGDDYVVKQDIKPDKLPQGSRGIILGNARELKVESKNIPF